MSLKRSDCPYHKGQPMQTSEFVFNSVNSEPYPKPITALVISPDKIGPRTGAMLFSHGWGGSRFQQQDKMEFTCDEFDLVCISVEYRQSGFDFDQVKGQGAYLPYDASFYQVFDVLNGLRRVLDNQPALNRKRLFHYGGSQGGHIALLSAIFAPSTFAFVYAASPMTHIDASKYASAGREFLPHELSARNAIEHADKIVCPVFLEHGTADDNVPCDLHTVALAAKLTAIGSPPTVRYHEDGGHDLQPATSRFDAFRAMAPQPMETLEQTQEDDFAAASTVTIQCADRILKIDWSKPTDSIELFSWSEPHDS